MFFKKHFQLLKLPRNPQLHYIPVAVLGTVLVTLSSATLANTPSVKNVMLQMIPIAQTMVKLKEEKAGLETEILNKKKENALWQDQKSGRLTKDYTKLSTNIETHNVNGDRLTTEINRHNASCDGERPEPQYTKCLNEEPVLARARQKFMDTAKNLQNRKTSLDDEWTKYSDLIGANDTTIITDGERLRTIATMRQQYSKQLDDYKNVLVSLCDAAAAGDDTIEYAQYCQSINWDGANQNLSPMTIIKWGTVFFQ